MLGMKDSGAEWIGQIPVNWDVVPFYTLLDNRQDALIDGPFGSDMKNEEYVDEGVPVIQLGSIREQGMDFSKMHYITEEKADSLSRHNAFPENIVIAKMMPAGKACEVPNTYSRYVVSADVARAYISDKYTRKFSVLALNSYATTQAEIESQGSTRARINLDKIRHIVIARPKSHNELERLVLYLEKKCSEIDSLTADIQSQIDTLEEYKKSVITETVTKGLNPDVEMKVNSIPWLDDVPIHWDILPLYCCFDERKNKNSFGTEQNLLSLSYGRIIRKDINTNGGLLPESFNTYNIVEAGDIIIRPTDLQNDKRSLRTGYVNEKGIITSAYIALKSITDLNSKYVHYLLHSYDVMKVFYNMGNGVRQGLNYDEFKKLLILKPPKEEQDAVVEYLNAKCTEIESIISEKKEQLSTLAEYKKSLIYEYVTGKKEVAAA